MDLRFRTLLSLEECIQRLHNAIDPLPAPKERARSTLTTTWAPRPLPAAGRRTTGFGYASGTRPVVGTLSERHFHLEKKAVATSRGAPIIRAICTGELTATEHGTQIAATVQRYPSTNVLGGGCALLVGVGLLSLVTVPVLMQLLFASDALGTGSPPLSKQDVGLSFCFPLLFLVFGLAMLLEERSASHAEAQYLITFLEQTCAETPVTPQAAPTGTAYTGKTHRLS